MSEFKYASFESQHCGAVCEVDDNEDMFVLRNSEDYESFVSLGNMLAGQYRFTEAVEAYEKALEIKSDAMLFIRIAGANLSLFRFDEAKKYYDKALDKGALPATVNFYYGMWYYLKGDYASAAKSLTECYPCDDEMKISVIYWQTMASIKAGISPALLKDVDSVKVKYHTAYKNITLLFKGDLSIKDIKVSENPLNSAIENYGLYIYTGEKRYLERCLDNKSVWPCIACLAALLESKQ